MLARLAQAPEFWRRREPAFGRRSDVAVGDRGGCGAGSAVTVGAVHRVAPDMVGSDSGPASLLGWLISGTRSTKGNARRLGRRQRDDGRSLGKRHWGPVCDLCRLGSAPRRRGAVRVQCGGPMSNPPFQQSKADCSRPTVNEPGPRGSQQIRGRRAAPAVLLSACPFGLRS
jgi:hypothetical protein